MAIKRYFATKDNTITNAFKENLSTRGTGSNMGAADILEVFSIFGQASSGSTELSRVILEFPVSGTTEGEIRGDRASGDIPVSGSVRFYLKLYNAKHSQTIPKNLVLNVQAVSQSWSEGTGLDMENYSDLTEEDGGSTWDKRFDSTAWGSVGGTFHTGVAYTPGISLPMYTADFPEGDEDLEVDVTAMVEEWIASSADASPQLQNYGFALYATGSQEAYYPETTGQEINNPGGARESFYTKKFFSRTSEFFFKRPVLEARWDSSRKDNRGNFLLSSSLATANDNLNTIYLYNYVNGELKDVPNLGTDKKIYVSLFSGSTGGFYEGGDGDDVIPSDTPVSGTTGSVQILVQDNDGNVSSTNLLVATGGIVSTGIYSASLAFTGGLVPGTGTIENVYDVWFTGSNSTVSAFDAQTQFFTGTIEPIKLVASTDYPTEEMITNIVNLKSSYTTDEKPRLRLYVREKDWNPNIYTESKDKPETKIIENAYYKVTRAIDDLVVVPYGTGSNNETRLSYDVSGNYFDLEVNLLQKDFMYNIKLAYYLNGDYQEQPETFKFRVEEEP